MCPIKTVNLSLNVPQEEGEFWRALARQAGVRSVGELHKRLLFSALEKLKPAKAKELLAIRINYCRLGSAALLALFCVSLLAHDVKALSHRNRSSDDGVWMEENI